MTEFFEQKEREGGKEEKSLFLVSIILSIMIMLTGNMVKMF